jgi:hypothetical protein
LWEGGGAGEEGEGGDKCLLVSRAKGHNSFTASCKQYACKKVNRGLGWGGGGGGRGWKVRLGKFRTNRELVQFFRFSDNAGKKLEWKKGKKKVEFYYNVVNKSEEKCIDYSIYCKILSLSTHL